MLLILGVASVVLATVSAKLCPPPGTSTTNVECRFFSKVVDCDQWHPPSTTATIKCKPLYHFLFDRIPSWGYTTTCTGGGYWNAKPVGCVPICGQPRANGVPLVVDGKPAASSKYYPWHVGLYRKNDRGLGAICGGTLITTKYFISAAHCFLKRGALQPADDYLAVTGKKWRDLSYNETDAQILEVRNIHTTNFTTRGLLFTNDIALIEMETHVDITESTLPVCVDWGHRERPIRPGEYGTVVGWGHWETQLKELQFARLPVVNSDVCKHEVPPNMAMYAYQHDKFCVGAPNGASLGKGDSGGGMVFRNKKKEWFLNGVVSLGEKGTFYAFLTNVTGYLNWMADIIREGDVNGRECGVDVSEANIVSGREVGDSQGFPWDVEIFGKSTAEANFTRWSYGVLVQPNLVISVSYDMLTDEGIGEALPMRLRVAWGLGGSSDLRDAAKSSHVRLVHYPSEQILDKYLYTVALLELETPIEVMPACVDWKGSVLRPLGDEEVGTAVWRDDPQSPSWARIPLVNSSCCKAASNISLLSTYNFCANISGGAADGFLPRVLFQNEDLSWYVRGVLGVQMEPSSGSSRPSSSRTIVYTDLADPSVREWLANTRGIVGKPKCGEFAALNLEKGNEFGLHMPWNVAVRVTEGNESSVTWGTIVRSNAVLTVSPHLSIRYPNSNSSLPPTNIQVIITASDGTTKFVDVLKVIPADDRCGIAGDPVCSLMLLVLRQPTSQTPACLDVTGAGATLPELTSPQQGVMESAPLVGSPNTVLHVVPYVERKECRGKLRETGVFPHGIYCVGPLSGNDRVLWNGAGFVTRAKKGWYLRGLTAFNWRTREGTPTGLYITVDLQDNVLLWLEKALKSAEDLLGTEDFVDEEESLQDLPVPPVVLKHDQDPVKEKEPLIPEEVPPPTSHIVTAVVVVVLLVLISVGIAWAIIKGVPGADNAAGYCLTLTR